MLNEEFSQLKSNYFDLMKYSHSAAVDYDDIKLIERQLAAMRGYLDILGTRIALLRSKPGDKPEVKKIYDKLYDN